ncbi:MAG: gliding motility-associated C-terminal domain-containing protein [Bacteroidia bacterium]
MNAIYTLPTWLKQVTFRMALLLLFCGTFYFQASATHYVGSDITYKCLDANGNYRITLVVYRDCGAPGGTANFCNGTCANISACTFSVDVWGADPSCSNTRFFSFNVTGVSVRDINPNPRCPTSKNTCTNMGCVDAGSLTPGIERYEFTGTVNIGPGSGIPASCCNVRFAYRNCCRNDNIQNIQPNWFYTDAIVNRCAATYPDCNSPDLTNDPYAIMCAGQGFIFNNGAFDPDLDSLVYSFTSSLEDYGVSATYIAPYSYDIPLPYTPPLTGNYPYGIRIDPLSGDIMLRPNAYPFTGVLALRMEQWRLINGQYVIVGVTRRDIQVYIKYCDPNNPPTLVTNPVGTPANRPKTKFETCVNQQLCFDITAKDTDFNPPSISDTTYLSWNKVMEQYGATFTPNYTGKRSEVGPREDTYKICWTPKDEHCKRGQPTTYPFTIKAEDSRCPYPGIVMQGFSIKVLPRAKVSLNKIDHKCGKWAVSYTKDPSYIPAQTFQSTTWMIARQPEDFSFAGGAYSYANVPSSPVLTFTRGGRYLVELSINMLGPSAGGFCTATYRDTLFVIDPVTPVTRDTFACKNSDITIGAGALYGQPPYTYRWFNNIKDTLTPLNGPIFTSANYTISPTYTRNYTLQVRDINGCRSWDSIEVQIKQLPVGLLPDSARICYGDTFTLNPGNNGGNIRSFVWNTADSTQIIVRRDSNTFTVVMTDTLGCKNADSTRLFVNARIMANAGLDTSICQKDTTTLMASGGQLYLWKNLTSGATIASKSHVPYVRVNPTGLGQPTKYEVTVYQSYPDTTNRNLECRAVDTVSVTVRPLPTLNKPSQPMLTCYGTQLMNLNPFVTPVPGQQGGTGRWSYPRSPAAVINPLTGPGITTQPQIKIDSLKSLPPGDNYLTYTNYVQFTYTEPTYGCSNSDSAAVTVYGRPPVNAGTPLIRCENLGAYELTTISNQTARGVSPAMTSANVAQCTWTGNGIDSIMIPSKRYFFNPTKPGVLKLPARNIMTYRYYQTYNHTYNFVNYTTNCVNSDTVFFSVTPVPVIDAGTEFSICKNEPVFNIAGKSGASVTPLTGLSYWTSDNGGINSGIITNGTEFDASRPGVPMSTATRQRMIFRDTTGGCMVADTTYINIVGYPEVNVSFSSTDDNLKEFTVCRNTGNYDLFTKIDDQFRKGNTNQNPNATYSYQGTTAWGPILTAVDNTPNPNAFFNSNDPLVTPGLHYAIFQVIQSNGAITCSNRDTARIIVEQPPIITVTPGGAMCAYSDKIGVNADVQPASEYTLQWKSGGGTFENATLNATNFVPTKSGDLIPVGKIWIYATSVRTGSTGVCPEHTDSTQIRVDAKPEATFTCPDCDGCEPLTSNIRVNPTGVPNATYRWIWDDNYSANTTDSSFTRTIENYSGTGIHPFRLMVTSGESTACTATSEPGAMIVHAKPSAGFDHDPFRTTIARPYYHFTNTSFVRDNSRMNYKWEMGYLPQVADAQRIFTEANPKNVQFKEDTTLVKLTVTTEYGCVDTFTRIMLVEPDITVFTPNAFYPNSQVRCPDDDPECNRHFQVAATGYATIEIFVFNRWGQQVYYSNKAEVGWNGRINNTGPECPQDVYIYQINATSLNGKLYKYSGSITLLR